MLGVQQAAGGSVAVVVVVVAAVVVVVEGSSRGGSSSSNSSAAAAAVVVVGGVLQSRLAGVLVLVWCCWCWWCWWWWVVVVIVVVVVAVVVVVVVVVVVDVVVVVVLVAVVLVGSSIRNQMASAATEAVSLASKSTGEFAIAIFTAPLNVEAIVVPAVAKKVEHGFKPRLVLPACKYQELISIVSTETHVPRKRMVRFPCLRLCLALRGAQDFQQHRSGMGSCTGGRVCTRLV